MEIQTQRQGAVMIETIKSNYFTLRRNAMSFLKSSLSRVRLLPLAAAALALCVAFVQPARAADSAADAVAPYVDDQTLEFLTRGNLEPPEGTTRLLTTWDTLTSPAPRTCRGREAAFGPLRACFPP